MKITNTAQNREYCTLSVFKKNGSTFEFKLNHSEFIYLELNEVTKPIIMQERKGNITVSYEPKPEKLDYYVSYTTEKAQEIISKIEPTQEIEVKVEVVEEKKHLSNALAQHDYSEEKPDYDTSIPKSESYKKEIGGLTKERDAKRLKSETTKDLKIGIQPNERLKKKK